ncbi:MAG: class I SAM-dependent methyltransferase [Chloroflexi bacterium]|nr:MAG: class I SAM-dependent methyltransferase [Chloroflexota bacterium]
MPLVAGDIHKLPHADNSIGAYLSFGVLEHFEHGMLPGLQEAYRVLKPGGVLVLTIPYPNIIHKLLVLRRKISGQSVLNDDEFYESTYDRSALADNVQQAGFNIELMMPTGHSYTLWGLGGPFRAEGYYRTTQFAEKCGAALKRLLPWPFNFMTLVIARK